MKGHHQHRNYFLTQLSTHRTRNQPINPTCNQSTCNRWNSTQSRQLTERALHLSRLSALEPQKEEVRTIKPKGPAGACPPLLHYTHSNTPTHTFQLHRLRWEASTRDSELLNLRKSVSDAQITVHHERETSNDQTAIITRLKSQQVEDRKVSRYITTSVCEGEEFSTDTSTPSSPRPTHEQRIQRLLALTQPVVSDITFLKEGSTAAGEALSEQYRVALHNAEMEMEKQVSGLK